MARASRCRRCCRQAGSQQHQKAATHSNHRQRHRHWQALPSSKNRYNNLLDKNSFYVAWQNLEFSFFLTFSPSAFIACMHCHGFQFVFCEQSSCLPQAKVFKKSLIKKSFFVVVHYWQKQHCNAACSKFHVSCSIK